MTEPAPIDHLSLITPHVDTASYVAAAQAVGLHVQSDSCAQHYLSDGWRLGLDPSPDFSTEWYLTEYPDVAAADVNPLVHYLLHGQAENRSPIQPPPRPDATGDDETIKDHMRTIEPFFDEAFYRHCNPDVVEADADPLVHYVTQGWKELRAPNRNSDLSGLVRYDPTLITMKREPLLHLITQCQTRGLAAGQDLKRYITDLAQDIKTLSAFFPREQYAKQLGERPCPSDPLSHYFQTPSDLRVNPVSGFSRQIYTDLYSDLIGKRDPYEHYILIGHKIGLFPNQDVKNCVESMCPQGFEVTDLECRMRLVSLTFDRTFYQEQTSFEHPDALRHYCEEGWHVGLSPNRKFDQAFYIKNNPEVAGIDFDPYLHFLLSRDVFSRRMPQRETYVSITSGIRRAKKEISNLSLGSGFITRT